MEILGKIVEMKTFLPMLLLKIKKAYKILFRIKRYAPMKHKS